MSGMIMLNAISTFNTWAERWLATMGVFARQSTLLVALAALVALAGALAWLGKITGHVGRLPDRPAKTL
jgi:hypothetical protein